jgi:hypothetical protein
MHSIRPSLSTHERLHAWGILPGPVDHPGRQIHADGPTRLIDLSGRQQRGESRPASTVMDRLAGLRLAHRERVAHIVGEILEIGFGTGLNLPHYPEPDRTITTTRRSRPWPRATECDRPPARWRRADQDVGSPGPDPGQLGSSWARLDRRPNLRILR